MGPSTDVDWGGGGPLAIYTIKAPNDRCRKERRADATPVQRERREK